MMTAAHPPFPEEVRRRVEVEGVTGAWMRDHFGEPHLHESDLVAVLAPTDNWAFQLETGAIVILAHMPEYELLTVESDAADANALLEELGLSRFRHNEFKSGAPPGRSR